MKQEFSLMDAAYNLFKAAEVNHTRLTDLIKKVDSSTALLNQRTLSIDNAIAESIDISVQRSAEQISKQLLKDLWVANKIATEAAERLEVASKKSFELLLTTQLAFLALSVFVLWLFFMKNIPTKQEFLDMLSAGEQLKKYGHVYDCDDRKCVEIDKDSGYVVKNSNAKLYYLKPR